MRIQYWLIGGATLGALGACGDLPPEESLGNIGTSFAAFDGPDGTLGSEGSAPTGGEIGNETGFGCPPTTCAELGWACGYTVDPCGNVIDCAVEGRSCSGSDVCVGGIDGPTECVTGIDEATCDLCPAIPNCSNAPEPTRITGRVVSPGRDDADTGNQVGVPNAIVYILRDNVVEDIPSMSSGIPVDGTSCDRCEDQNLGPVLTGAVTDSAGNFVIEGNIPVGVEFLLIVQAGKFRRATRQTIVTESACTTTALATTLPDNPARLPRTMSDGLAVNLPRVAVSTGQIDAMECVFEKMGIDHNEFGNPGDDGLATPRIHLYRGGRTAPGAGARIDDGTPHDTMLYGDQLRMQNYDLVVSDCEGQTWDGRCDPGSPDCDELTEASYFPERDAYGSNVREYVNRGGRVFASHLSFSWLHENGAQAYDADDALATGLGHAAEWDPTLYGDTEGRGRISMDRANSASRIEEFAEWMIHENIVDSTSDTFTIREPRSTVVDIGGSSEQFVYREGGSARGGGRIQQFSFNTPYGAPDDEVCGRVAHSGFHVSASGDGTNLVPFVDSIFPDHCSGDLTDQEKVLLYMLFDLGACVGDDLVPPPCVPVTCEEAGARCGFTPDGCGDVLDCGACGSIG